MRSPTFVAVLGLLLLVSRCAPMLAAEAISAEDVTFFENKIRPMLVKHCYACHSAESDELGGKLRLDHRGGWQTGGESGPALVVGNPEESLLLQAMRYDGLQMPPEEPLPDQVINDFAEWIRRGAPDPRDAAPALTGGETKDAEADNPLWALQPIEDPTPPAVETQGWARDPIDQFVLSRLERESRASPGLKLTKDASPQTLARRLYFDLIGMAPTMDEMSAYLDDYSQRQEAATEALVDRLLASHHFGERWGRHWLDVARFGESNGNDGLSRNPSFPHAWRYRDYVIAALNNDLPYDQFILEQIAGDLLPSDTPEERDRRLVATGFLAIGSKPAKAMNENFEMDIVADQIDVIGRGVLGLSVGCARCHDHKFDPIPTKDYYALAGIFTSTEALWGTAAHEPLTAPVTDLLVLKAAEKVPPPADFVETVLVLDSNTGKPRPFPKSKWEPGTPLAMGVRDRPKPEDTKINIKGESKKTGEVVPRGFLSACEVAAEIKIDPKQSGRLQLAQWLTHPSHPLTARVIVNRVWQHLFGEGLVRTPDDFGKYGERPTHPELLDYLASRFVREGWSIKKLARAIALSRAYQLASDADEASLAIDPQNRFLARHQRRRLDAESLRDSVLLASGQLDPQPGNGSLMRHRDILVNLAGNLHQPSRLRSVYLCYLRSSPPPELEAFDLPDFTAVCGQRTVSTVTGQALHLYNSPFIAEQAACFARRLMSDSADATQRVQLAWRHAFQREPSPAEIELALRLTQQTEPELQSEEKAWASLCQALFCANEFRYVD